jgi:hypothetical protein
MPRKYRPGKTRSEPDYIDERHRRMLLRYAKGEAFAVVAQQEGLTPSYARTLKNDLLKRPAVQNMLREIHTKANELAAYGLQQALVQAQECIDFAIKLENPMARMKSTELKAKLAGLLIERVEVVSIDISGALQRAEARVLSMSTVSTPAIEAPVRAIDPAIATGMYYTGPNRQGDPLGGE